MAFRSIVYLASFTGLGYVLMKGKNLFLLSYVICFFHTIFFSVTEPSEEKKKEIRRAGSFDTDAQRKKALFVEKLKEAAYGDAVWVKKSEQAKPETQQQQQPTKREIN